MSKGIYKSLREYTKDLNRNHIEKMRARGHHSAAYFAEVIEKKMFYSLFCINSCGITSKLQAAIRSRHQLTSFLDLTLMLCAEGRPSSAGAHPRRCLQSDAERPELLQRRARVEPREVE